MPDDGAAVVIEEVYPFPLAPGNGPWLGPPNVTEAALMKAYVKVHRDVTRSQ